jgi:hypothetical protein
MEKASSSSKSQTSKDSSKDSTSKMAAASAGATGVVIKRKPRASALSKYVRRMRAKILGMSVPFIRCV